MPRSIPVCDACGMDTLPEWFMVHDHIWRATGLGTYDAVLCVGCLEKRLGRQLRPSDFTDAWVNEPSIVDSDRLLDRLGWRKVCVDDAGREVPCPSTEDQDT